QIHVFGSGVHGQSVSGGGQVGEATLPGLLQPCLVIAVAVEDDPLMLGEYPADQLGQVRLEVPGCLQLVRELFQLLGHDGVQGDIGAGDGLGCAQHPELELVAGKGHGGGAVPIRVVLADGRQGVHADLQRPLAGALEVRVVDDGVHHSGELVSQEDGEHGGRCLLGAQPVVVAGEGHRGPQEL
ncbi:hypothetical protein ICNMLN_ICNMLN_06120, partial [Dysosmobacter welbionis]